MCGTRVATGVACEQPKLAVTFQPGQATVTLTFGSNSPFTYGTLAVRLTSSDVCSPGTACAAGATITVDG